MSTYLKFLSKNKLYAVIEALGLSVSLSADAFFFTHYYMTKEFRQ